MLLLWTSLTQLGNKLVVGLTPMPMQLRKFAAKRLSPVEVNPKSSHQHEFHGDLSLRYLLGEEKSEFSATFIWIGDIHIVDSGKVTWYDSRKGNKLRAPEWRLYYKSDIPTQNANPGDLLITACGPEGKLLLLLIDKTSPLAENFIWMLGLEEGIGEGFQLTTLTAASS